MNYVDEAVKLAVELIARHEGFRSKPYRCTAGKLTIGFGRNLDDVGISREEGKLLLRNDVFEAYDYCSGLVPHFSEMTTARQLAFIDLMYNIGPNRFRTFKKMLKALEERDYKEASKQLLDSAYKDQVGQRAYELASMVEIG